MQACTCRDTNENFIFQAIRKRMSHAYSVLGNRSLLPHADILLM